MPLFTATWALLILNVETSQLQSLLLSALLFATLSSLAVYKKWLTTSGAVAAFWVALLLLITGGYKAFIAPGIFLISGSILSKLNKPQKEKDGRNALQVFANGIIGILFMIMYKIVHDPVYLITAIASFCISMSDNTSSEIGMYLKGSTYDILSFKKMPPGVSGGMSLQGTFAGLAGAMLLSYAATYYYSFSFIVFMQITIAGFTGMLVDSILGSWLQVKYKTADGLFSDDAVPGAIKAKGLVWCNNDAVNICSNILITLLFFFILKQTN